MRFWPALSLVLLGCASAPAPAPAGPPPPGAASASPLSEHEETEATFAAPNGPPDNICKFAQHQCATERWGVKIGIDPLADQVHPGPASHTILDLRGEPAPGPRALCTPRYPAEKETLELRDVRLVCFKWENGPTGDKDFHLVVEDPGDPVVAPADDPDCSLISPKKNPHHYSDYHTLIVEIPDPGCLDTGNPWRDRIAAARSAFLASFSPTTAGQRVNATVSVRGVRFFDVWHGQLGVVPTTAIELHPVLGFCVGQRCRLP